MAERGRNLPDRLRLIRRASRAIEVAQVRRFGRSLLSTVFRTRVLVLETVGRRSGARRATTLACHQDGSGSLLVVGGAGGQTRLPDWVANLRACPSATVVVDRRRRPVTATELHGEERAGTWSELRAVWPRIDAYEARAGRPVPVFRLSPRAG
jgi:deazaflavin-dependent oxidoreductase (nitroreductase family)